jgi:hypothetical protein
MPPTAKQRAQARRITAAIAKLDFVLPGTVIHRYTRCGRPHCRCMADPPQPHGPYWWWTRKVNTKTITQILTDEQYAHYRPWFDNARRAKELLAELEALSLTAVEVDPRTTRRPGRPTSPQPSRRTVDKPRSKHR